MKPAEALPKIRITRKGADRIVNGHPWIFSSDVADRAEAQPGDAVTMVDPGGRALGTAHYSSTSQITLRLLSNRVEPIDRGFFERRLKQAIGHRERMVKDSEACRLVFSEADLLPGLIVDRYGPYLVLQALDQGMDRSTGTIVEILTELLSPAGILARNDASVRARENLPLETRLLWGDLPEQLLFRMNGLTLTADLRQGQKTGAYLDQRENYLAVARHAHGRMLDCFTSTGGFALHAAANVESIEAVDSSALSLTIAAANAHANRIGNIHFREADVFEFLAGLSGRDSRYSTIVLDPPAFAKSRKQIDSAARGYKEINLRALRLLEPGGILVTCSCSHHMSEAMLLETVAAAALESGKTLRVIERRTQASDHPILLTVPETLYLKCLIFQVLAL